MSYLGASLVHGDRTEEGMALLDEALAAVAGGEVEDFIIVEEIFCQLFSACEHAQDVQRAEQWIRVGEQIAERRQLPAVSAYCRTHYGGILTAAGRWPEADVALTEAVRLWALGKRSLKAGALIRLADLRIKQGRYDEAASLLEDQTDGEAVLPRAALHLARGEPTVALDLLERAAQKADPGSGACIPLLAQLVEAQLACGEDPQQTIADLAACAEVHPTPYTSCPGRAGPGPRRAGRSAGVAAGCAGRLHARPSCRSRCRCAASTSPGPAAGRLPRSRWRRRAPRWPPSRSSRRHGTSTPLPRCCASSARRSHRRDPLARCSPGARPTCSSCWGKGCPTRRSPSDSSSAARPSNTTSATCWLKLGLRNRAEATAYAVRARTSPQLGEFPDTGPSSTRDCWVEGRFRSLDARARGETMNYDAIVIGARAAGSPTAMLLARKGYDVLAVDRATFPSDTLSTHVVHAPGVAALQAVGAARRGARVGLPGDHRVPVRLRPGHHQRHHPTGGGHHHGLRPASDRARRGPRGRCP